MIVSHEEGLSDEGAFTPMWYYAGLFLAGLGLGLWLSVIGLGLATLSLIVFVTGFIDVESQVGIGSAIKQVAFSVVALQTGYFVSVFLQYCFKCGQKS